MKYRTSTIQNQTNERRTGEQSRTYIRVQERAHTRQEETTRTLVKSVCTQEKKKPHVYTYKSVRTHDKKKPHEHYSVCTGDNYKTTGRNRCCTEAILDFP